MNLTLLCDTLRPVLLKFFQTKRTIDDANTFIQSSSALDIDKDFLNLFSILSNESTTFSKELKDISRKLLIGFLRYPKGCPSETYPKDCSSETYPKGCPSETYPKGCSSETYPKGCPNHLAEAQCGLAKHTSVMSDLTTNPPLGETYPKGCSSETYPKGCSSETYPKDCSSETYPKGCSSETYPQIDFDLEQVIIEYKKQVNLLSKNILGQQIDNTCQTLEKRYWNRLLEDLDMEYYDDLLKILLGFRTNLLESLDGSGYKKETIMEYMDLEYIKQNLYTKSYRFIGLFQFIFDFVQSRLHPVLKETFTKLCGNFIESLEEVESNQSIVLTLQFITNHVIEFLYLDIEESNRDITEP